MSVRYTIWKNWKQRLFKTTCFTLIFLCVFELKTDFFRTQTEVSYLSYEAENPVRKRSRKDLEILDQFCHRFNMKNESISSYTLNHLHVDYKRKVLYCYVPKVACTSWKRIFAKLTNPAFKDIDVTSVQRDKLHLDGTIPKLSHKKFASKRENILKTFKKFFFVRDPYTRIVSAYKDKLESEELPSQHYLFHKEIGQKIEKKYRGKSSGGHNVTFPEFIRYITEPNGDSRQKNEHWRTVHDLCSPCSIEYDFMGRYESLINDANYVLDWIGVRELVGEFPNSDRPFHVQKYDRHYYDQLKSSDRRNFFKFFVEDFLPFNYSVF